MIPYIVGEHILVRATVGAPARWMGLAIALLVLFVGPLALAAPSELDRSMARSLAAEGYEALVNKKYATAEDRLRRADQLVHAPTIVVDHARALAGLGRLLEARERYQQVVREGVDPKAPASWKQALADAEREAAQLEPRIAWLVIRVEGPSNPNVTVDGHAVPLNALGTKRAVDPGLRAVRVTALGYVSADQSVTLREGEERELTLTLKPPPSIELAEGDTEASQPATPTERPPSSVPMFAAFGAGAVGIVVGSVTGAMALSLHSDLAKRCPGEGGWCRAKTDEEKVRFEGDISRYHTLGTISGIGFGVGLAGVGAGVFLLLTSGRSEPAKTGSVQPLVGPGTLGVQGSF